MHLEVFKLNRKSSSDQTPAVNPEEYRLKNVLPDLDIDITLGLLHLKIAMSILEVGCILIRVQALQGR